MARRSRFATVEERKRWRALHGYLPYMECLKILGMRRGVLRGLIRAGKVPPPEEAPECFYYTLAQLHCLLQAKFYATVDFGTYIHLCVPKFAEYIKAHWPIGDEDAQIIAGKKKGRWSRRKHTRNAHSVRPARRGAKVFGDTPFCY